MATTPLLATRRPVAPSIRTSSAAAAFNPMQPSSATANNLSPAVAGDFLGASGQPLPPPNVNAPTATVGAFGSRPAVSTTRPASTAAAAFNPLQPSPLQDPGNNMVNQGYGEQALNYTQNRLLEDPYANQMQGQFQNTQTPSQGEQYQNQNLGTLNGPGQGDQYWNQQQGQFNDPFAGENFTRQATQNFSPTGAAGAFNDQAQQQYGQMTGFTGAGNTQGQYGQTSSDLAGGTQGEQGLGQIAGQYDSQGRYTDPNLAAGQYQQTQGAFGDLPIANFDPFYDRAEQLGVQNYNRQAAGRGVYGSSEALSGVGNVVTDIEAQRANRSFDAEMQRAQEQRARQELLGNQARMGDLSGQGAFQANLSGAQTYAGINNMQANQQLARNELLGNQANAADTQALGAQNANISGMSALGNIAGQADTAQTNRFNAATGAMSQADRDQLARVQGGADIAFRGDENARQDYTASQNAANQAAQTGLDRTRLGADIAATASGQDLQRLNAFNNQSQGAENQRQNRVQSQVNAVSNQTNQALNSIGEDVSKLTSMSQADFDQYAQATLMPKLQAAGMSQKDADNLIQEISAGIRAGAGG